MARQGTGSSALGGLGQGPPGRGGLMTLAFLSVQGPETVVAAHFGIPLRRGLVAAKAILFGWRPFHATRRVAGWIIPSHRPLAGPCRGAALLQGVVQTGGILGQPPHILSSKGRGGFGRFRAESRQSRKGGVSPRPPLRGWGRDPVVREGMDFPRNGPERYRGDQDQQQGLLHMPPSRACYQARLLLAVSGGLQSYPGPSSASVLRRIPRRGAFF